MFGGPRGNLPSTRNHSFSQVPQANIARSAFDRTHGLKTTFGAGYVIPIFVDEVLPGDTFNLNTSVFLRTQTPVVPFMDNLWADFHFFFVPNRLVWDNFQKFMGEQTDPDDSTDFLVPQMAAGIIDAAELGDYLGLPTDTANNIQYNSLVHRCYNLIWNEWYRDENIQDSVIVDTDDGPDTLADYTDLLPRGKRKDYFTGALPWPQKGPAVSLPLGTSAPVIGIGKQTQTFSAGPAPRYETGGTGTRNYADYMNIDAGAGADSVLSVEEDPNNPGFPGIFTDLSVATAADLNSVREAFTVQQMLERDARGGTRYTEITQSHFGVTSPDARLQRPEYLGGGTKQITTTPIPQTSATGATGTPQGNLSAMGTMSGSNIGFVKSFTEHGHVLGFVSVRADQTYQYGKNRMWDRQTRFDFFWPTFAHLGEQAILTSEIYCDGSANDALVFGYQERYAEYRYKPSLVTGQMRSNNPNTLDVWHLAQELASFPELSPAFLVENPPLARVLAVPTQDAFLLDAHFAFRCVRPMPVYSVPGLTRL